MLSSASSSETSPLGLLARLLSDAKQALSDLPKWERVVHIFWLLGPFILLIERTPADLWLSLLGLIFVGRSIVRRDGAWLRHFWVRAAFVFWAVCLLSAALSSQPSYALGEAFVWFRFPLFAMATAFWLGQDKRLLYAMLVSTGLGLIVMSGILTAEMYFVGQTGGRLTWPYDDLVPGGYMAKTGLPVFIILTSFVVGSRLNVVLPALILALSFATATFLTGERINLILLMCGGAMAPLFSGVRWQRLVGFYLLGTLFAASLILTAGDVQWKYTTGLVRDLPIGPDSDYFRVMYGGILAFLEAPYFGIGVGNYRDLCSGLLQGFNGFRCDNHPHNYYIQFLAETGLVGFCAGVTMLATMIWTAFAAGRGRASNLLMAIAFVIPFGLFFPIQSTADFFGQWNNIFMWSAVALSMAAAHLEIDAKA
jgi:O-antigen ligase